MNISDKFNNISELDAISYQSIRDVANNHISKSNSLKLDIWKSHKMGEDFNKRNLDSYLSYLYDLLSNWEDFGNNLQKNMRKVTPKKAVYTFKYENIKSFIYANYDYASVIKFTEDLLKRVQNGDVKDSSDFDESLTDVIEQAFDDNGKDVASLLDNISPNGFICQMDTVESEVHFFNIIKNYDKLFQRKDKSELYKSINAVLTFMINYKNIEEYVDYSDIKLYINTINTIFSYIQYSVAIYIIRIAVLYNYAFPYLRNNVEQIQPALNPPSDGVTEAVEHIIDPDKVTSIDKNEVSVMRLIEEAGLRSIDNHKKLIDSLHEFLDAIGAIYDNYKYQLTFYTYYPKNSADWIMKITDNELYKFIRTNSSYFDLNSYHINELHELLKDSLFNNNAKNAVNYSAKQELLSIISKINCDAGDGAYRELASELFKISWMLTGSTVTLIGFIRDKISDEMRNTGGRSNTTISSNKDLQEMMRMLNDFYSELVMVIIQKFKDIENGWNSNHTSEQDKLIDQFNIKIPGTIKDNKIVASSNVNTKGEVKGGISDVSLALPDTTRMPLEVVGQYGLPAFEAMEMYDEYLRSLDIFKEDAFMEAFNLTRVSNMVQAAINNVIRKWVNFFTNKNVQAAIKYVEEHANDVAAKNYDGIEMQIQQFKKKGNNEAVGFDNGLIKGLEDSLVNGLKNFKEENAADMQSAENFIKSLYPSEVVYNWFHGENAKNGATMLTNYLLYYNEGNTKVDVPGTVTISGDQINDACESWVETIKGAKDLNEKLTQYNKVLMDSQKNLRSVVSKLVNDSAKQQKQNTTENTNQNNTQSTDQTQNTTTNTNATSEAKTEATEADNNVNMNNSEAVGNYLLTEVMKAITNIYLNVITTFMNYIRTEYSYIQTAYSKGKNE